MRKRPRTLLKRAAAVVASVVFAIFFLHLISCDAPAPDDSDMRPVPPPALADADNAYFDYLKMFPLAKSLTNEERQLIDDRESKDAPELGSVEPLIRRNAELLRLFDESSQRKGYLPPNPRWAAWWDYVKTAKLASLRSALLLQKNRVSEALDESLKIVDAGQMLLSSSVYGGLFAGVPVRSIGVHRIRGLVDSGKLDRAQLLRVARRLSDLRSSDDAVKPLIRNDYLSCVDFIEKLADDKERRTYKSLRHRIFERIGIFIRVSIARNRYVLQPNRYRAQYLEFHRRNLAGNASSFLS